MLNCDLMGNLDNYQKVPVMFLEAETPLRITIYLHMPMNENVVLFREKGQNLTLDDLMKIQKLPPSRVLTLKNELDEAMKSLSGDLLDPVSPGGEIKDTSRVMAKSVIGNLGSDKVDTQTVLNDTSQLVSQIMDQFQTVSSKKSFLEFVQSLGHGNTPLETHNKHVGALAVLVMLSLGKSTQEEVADIAFASSLHDLCLDQVPENLMNAHLNGDDLTSKKSQVLLADQIAAVYKTHIDLILKKITDAKIQVTTGSLKIIAQHHENQDGSGLYKIPGPKIYRPARVLRIVDDLIALINSKTKPHTLKEAFAVLKSFNQEGYYNPYDSDILDSIEKNMST